MLLVLHYTRGITPKRGMRGGAHLRGLRLGNIALKKRRNDGESLEPLR